LVLHKRHSSASAPSHLFSHPRRLTAHLQAACLSLRGDANKVLLLQVFKERWFTSSPDALQRHPVSVAKAVCDWFRELAKQSYGVSACYPIASIEANLSLAALKSSPGLGSQIRKFLSEQLKDKDANALSRVRLAVRAAAVGGGAALADHVARCVGGQAQRRVLWSRRARPACQHASSPSARLSPRATDLRPSGVLGPLQVVPRPVLQRRRLRRLRGPAEAAV
jgi:hypothetical protein